MANASRSIEPQKVTPQFDLGEIKIRVFRSIPENHHDIISLLGKVLVYQTDALCREGIQNGALYVVEDQYPVGGMSWDTYDRLNQRYGLRDQPRVRIKASRRVIRITKRDSHPDHWWHVMPSGFHDGPLPDWSVAHNMIGKVVGIYHPKTISE